jgi:hypothetical protein
MAKWFSLASLVVAGLIVADIVTHGSEAKAAAQGVQAIEVPAISGLVGGNNVQTS